MPAETQTNAKNVFNVFQGKWSIKLIWLDANNKKCLEEISAVTTEVQSDMGQVKTSVSF